MPCIPRATCPPGSLTTASVSLWTDLSQVSLSPPCSATQPGGPVASGIGKSGNKRKANIALWPGMCFHVELYVPPHNKHTGMQQTYWPHPTTSLWGGACACFWVSHVKETANYHRRGSQLHRGLNNHKLLFEFLPCHPSFLKGQCLSGIQNLRR